MARELFMDSKALPDTKKETPYPDHVEVSRGINQHVAELFTGAITGAGGVGGTLDLPFDPSVVEIINPAGTPRGRKLLVGPNIQVNTLTLAAGTGLSMANNAAGRPRRVTLAVALAADAEVVQVIAWGHRNINGST